MAVSFHLAAMVLFSFFSISSTVLPSKAYLSKGSEHTHTVFVVVLLDPR